MKILSSGSQRLALIAGLMLASGIAMAKDLYIAQAAAGTADGSSCANAYIVTFFNTAANWGTGAAQIGPGTTVHLCGTITDNVPGDSYLTFQGSGTSGSPITLYFEAGTSLTNTAYWGNNIIGAINASGKSWIVIDGGSNGLIQNTGNGTGLAFEHNSAGVVVTGGSNITIQHLTIANICQYSGSASDTNGCVTSGSFDQGILVNGSTQVLVTGNTVHDAAIGVFYEPPSGATGATISRNTIYRCNWGIGVAAPTALASGVTIASNEIHDSSNWDNPSDSFHHNGIHAYDVSPGSGLVNTTIYNNYIHDINSACSPNSCTTAWIFMDDNSGGISGTLGFNNVLTNSSLGGPGNPYITGGGTWYNNTILGNGSGSGISPGSGSTIVNNVFANLRQFITQVTSPATIDHNLYMSAEPSGCTPWVWGGGTCTGQGSLSAWQAACACDAHSAYQTFASINASGRPALGFPVPGVGANLTGLGIAALNSDRAGVARPASGVWDAGAYQYTGGPAPPTGLTVVVH